MLTLAINTASSNTEIAFLNGEQILKEESWPSTNNEAEKLMPAIKELISPHTFEDIKKIIVVKGPGSFTGLRVGVAVANTIAYLTGAELNAVSTFAYWHAKSPKQDATLLTFAGKKAVYINDGEVVNLEQINNLLAEKNITETFGDITQDQIDHINSTHHKATQSFAETLLKISNFETTPLVKPLYIKPPSITKPKCST